MNRMYAPAESGVQSYKMKAESYSINECCKAAIPFNVKFGKCLILFF